MLEEWRLRMSTGARLSTFIKYLRKCKLKPFADILEQEFFPVSLPKSTLQEIRLFQDSNRTVKFLTLFSMVLILVAMIIIIIYVANLNNKNEKDYSSTSQPELIDSTLNETLRPKENHYFNGAGKPLNESTLLPDYVDKLSTTERTQSQVRDQTKLVIAGSDVLAKLFNPKTNHENLARLQFNDSLGQICNESHNETLSSMIVLPKLQEILLDLSKKCDGLLDVILNYIVMTSLKVFRLKGFITNTSIQQTHEFLHKYYRSLQEIHIGGVLEGTINIFEIRNTVPLNDVKLITVKLEESFKSTDHRKIINDRFCSIFPVLTRFETKNILISLEELFRLQKCSILDHVNTKVTVNVDDIRNLEETNWQENFQTLKYVAVNFQFDMCPDHTFFEKLIKKLDTFEKYNLCSNCNMASSWRKVHCIKKSKPT